MAVSQSIARVCSMIAGLHTDMHSLVVLNGQSYYEAIYRVRHKK